MKSIAIIPARGGSKRIPKKNIKKFSGKPIINYSIEAALKSGLFSEVIVSTDSEEIAQISRAAGAVVPFLRSKENANDIATTADALNEVTLELRKIGKDFDFACCIYPTALFMAKGDLKKGLDLLLENDFDTVLPVVEFSYPILRSFKIENEKLKMNWPEHYDSRSQDLEASYHDAGQWYWYKPEKLLENLTLFTTNTGAVQLTEDRVQDIDSETDWQIAELKYKSWKSRNQH